MSLFEKHNMLLCKKLLFKRSERQTRLFWKMLWLSMPLLWMLSWFMLFSFPSWDVDSANKDKESSRARKKRTGTNSRRIGRLRHPYRKSLKGYLLQWSKPDNVGIHRWYYLYIVGAYTCTRHFRSRSFFVKVARCSILIYLFINYYYYVLKTYVYTVKLTIYIDVFMQTEKDCFSVGRVYRIINTIII